MASKNRSHHDVLAPPPGNHSKEINLTQGEDVPLSDREEEIRPSNILPNDFKTNTLGVSASKGSNASLSNQKGLTNRSEDLTFRSDSNGQMFCGFLRPPSQAGSSKALSTEKHDNINK